MLAQADESTSWLPSIEYPSWVSHPALGWAVVVAIGWIIAPRVLRASFRFVRTSVHFLRSRVPLKSENGSVVYSQLTLNWIDEIKAAIKVWAFPEDNRSVAYSEALSFCRRQRSGLKVVRRKFRACRTKVARVRVLVVTCRAIAPLRMLDHIIHKYELGVQRKQWDKFRSLLRNERLELNRLASLTTDHSNLLSGDNDPYAGYYKSISSIANNWYELVQSDLSEYVDMNDDLPNLPSLTEQAHDMKVVLRELRKLKFPLRKILLES